MEAVMTGYPAGGSTKLVLLGIAMHTGPGGSWPSMAELARYAGVDRSNAKRAIRSLLAEGWITCTENGGGNETTRPDRRPNAYGIRWERLHGGAAAHPRLEHGGAEAPPRRVYGGAPAHERGGASAPNGGAPAPPEPTHEQIHEPTQEKDTRDRSNDGMEVKIDEQGWQRSISGAIVGPATTEMVVLTSGGRPASSDEVQQVFDTWIAATGRTGRTRLDDKRRRAIERALRDYPLPDVLDAVRGWAKDPWAERVNHNDLTVLLRDAEHIEKFRRLWQEGPPKVRVEPKGYRTIRNTSDDPDAFEASMAALFRPGDNGERPPAIETQAVEGRREPH
jgi:hypothetical protein